MVSYTFRWAHPAEEVYVTGTFDNWSKSENMPKVGNVFEKDVELPDTSDKIYYKFVVDGTWTTNSSDPKEKDEGGNQNNVLTPEALLASLPATSAIMNSVNADSTTAQLAKDVPLEKENKEETPEQLPGSFPETPAAKELNNPIGISPLPAAAGGLNPIKLAPGEPVPKDLQTADLNSNVKLDRESYEKSDALPGVNISDLNFPAVGGLMIPESSLPMGNGNVNINSVGANATTAALAAQVPKEPKVPDVIKESQDKAGVNPETSGIASAVEEKKEMDEELKDKVPEAPSTSEGTSGKGTEKSEGDKTLRETAAATAAGIGAGAATYAYAAEDKAAGLASKAPAPVQQQLPTAVQDTIATGAKQTKIEEALSQVPTEVKDSIIEAGKAPEAIASTEAVEGKKAVEAELLKEVKTVNTAGESAPKAGVIKESEVPASTTQEAPKVVEPPAAAKDIPGTSTPPNGLNGTTATPHNGAGPAAPKTPEKSSKADPATPGSSKSDQKKKNRVSGLWGKLKSKISHKEGN